MRKIGTEAPDHARAQCCFKLACPESRHIHVATAHYVYSWDFKMPFAFASQRVTVPDII